MALLLKESARLYDYVLHDLADYRTKEKLLVNSPVPIISIITVYLLFVFKWGPEYMKNRKPYNLTKTLIIYNVLQMVYCLGIVISTTSAIPINTWKCNPIEESTPESETIINAGYAYFILKIIDLLDTVFFVLKKNARQITLLHVYHHSSMVCFVWFGIKYIPGGQGVYILYINCIVHVIMYGYYLLSVYDDKYKTSIWWKKHITQLQLFQFGLLFILFSTPLIYDCGYPKSVCKFVLLMSIVMISMFSNFYYKAYIKKNKHTS